MAGLDWGGDDDNAPVPVPDPVPPGVPPSGGPPDPSGSSPPEFDGPPDPVPPGFVGVSDSSHISFN